MLPRPRHTVGNRNGRDVPLLKSLSLSSGLLGPCCVGADLSLASPRASEPGLAVPGHLLQRPVREPNQDGRPASVSKVVVGTIVMADAKLWVVQENR